jgi:antitoxin ParD1/3/4
MNVSLIQELEQFVHAKVKSGRYLSASEGVRDALRLLEERGLLVRSYRLYQARLADLQKEITLGVESADQGELYEGAAVVQELLEQNKQRLVRTVE